MTFAPATLTALAAYWISQKGVNLGIVGDQAHAAKGVSYHLGKSQLLTDAYSIQTARDKAGLTEAAAAIDLGKLDGSYPALRRFSDWLAKRCLAGDDPATFDVREVIYTADGKKVLGYKDGVNFLIPDYGNDSHLWHTHISFYRDSEKRDKVSLFQPYFTPKVREEPMQDFTYGTDAKAGTLLVATAGHYALRLSDGTLHGPLDAPYEVTPSFGPVKLATPIPGGPAGEDRRTGFLFTTDGTAYFMLGNAGVSFKGSDERAAGRESMREDAVAALASIP
jgi:hypothetical protein